MLSTTMAPLAQMQRWLNWGLFPDARFPLRKPKKLPINPRTGHVVDVTDSSAWCSYEEALAQAQARGLGVGYVFAKGDNLFFLDIDGCVDPATGTWTQLAQHLMAVWGGHVAIEVSQSGQGLHIFGYASQIPDHAKRNVPLGIELYDEMRFAAFTDAQSSGSIGTDVSDTLAAFIASYFPFTKPGQEIVDWCDEGDGANPNDEELLNIMLHSGQKSAGATFNENHVPFAALWNADADTLGKRWPDTGGKGRGFDGSSADAALAALLAYWCGGNCERMQRFMERSALKRDKWEERPNYLTNTILGACATVTNRAQPREVGGPLIAGESVAAPAMRAEVAVGDAATPTTGGITAVVRPRKGTPYLSFSEHERLFEGCVWIAELNRIWVPGNGTLQDKPRFDITYGGRTFTIRQDSKTTQSAWDAFTQNQGYSPPVAQNVCFRPHLPPGSITQDGLLNCYFPISTPQLEGDPTKFVRHLAKLFPHPDDCAVVVSYMARTVRSPGHKNQWWPVIQGVQGNGKTVLNQVMQFSIGHRYVHLARASALAKTAMQFNAWVFGKLYLGLEEINVSDKRDFLDDFKDIVTNTMVALEAKGKDQSHGDNCLNGMMFTNHPDAMPVARGDRRYAVLFCGQQDEADLARDGMTGEYFVDLYDWLMGTGAYAHLGPDYGLRVANWWLRQAAPIDMRYDPAGACQRAPRTTSTELAMAVSLGTVEQEVLEQVARGAAGFAGGWVSSFNLGTMLGNLRIWMPHTKRDRMLATLGYKPHPGLFGGRAPRPPEGILERPVLYVRDGHPSLNLGDPEAILQGFERAQRGLGGVTGLAAVR